MKIIFENKDYTLKIDAAHPLDITIPIGAADGPNAFFLSAPQVKAVESAHFIGDVRRGGSCNCEDISFNPHGNGTHTECAGHISHEKIFIFDVLRQSFFKAFLITVPIEDNQISGAAIEKALRGDNSFKEAIVIRSLPNNAGKKHRKYSGNNPPYFSIAAIEYLNKLNIKHIITDLPSLDKEDDAALIAHHGFFAPQGHWLKDKTVTEMAYIENKIPDGRYMLEIQIAAFKSDASPSRLRLYRIINYDNTSVTN